MILDKIGAVARYLLLTTLLFLLQQATGNIWVLSLLLLLLLLPVVSWLANLYVRKNLRAKLMLDTTLAKNHETVCALQITNTALLPAMKLRCRISLLNDLTCQEQTVDLILGVGAKQKGSREFLLESKHCGRVYVCVKSLQLLDYFGLFSVKVPVKAGARLTVLPDLFACDASVVSMSAVADESAASRKGDDRTEVFQLREYQSGDDIRQIHWKLSSKLDNLILKDPSQSVSRSLLVFWDKRIPCSAEYMDAMAEVAASVCHGLCESGTAFDLCWTEKNELELRQIRDMDSLLQSIPALVTQAGEADCPTPDMQEYGNVIYISCQIPEGEIGNEITCLICSDTTHEGENVIVFTPENYQEKIQRLEV